jgi:hypothetical protein
MGRLRIIGLACLACVAAGAAAQEKPVQAPSTAQKTFATAEEAANALVSAAETFDRPALKSILGPDGDYLVAPGEPAQDQATAMAFAARARQKLTVIADSKNPNLATIIVGDQDWPLPIPIVRKAGQWRFDSAAGRQEILYRTIGSNELDGLRHRGRGGFPESETVAPEAVQERQNSTDRARHEVSSAGFYTAG